MKNINIKYRILLLFILVITILFSTTVLSVGVKRFSYNIPEFEFKPGLEKSINYEAIYSTRNTVISVKGAFSNYTTLSKDYIPLENKDKKFTLTIKIPLNVNAEDFKPGTNTLMLTVEDDLKKAMEEETGMFILTTAARTPIRINVPYPGYYAEFDEFELPSLNNGLDTSLKFSIWNRGKNDLVNTNYDFIVKDSAGDALITKTEGNINIPTQEKRYFYISPIETGSLNPGDYQTTLTYDYSDKSVSKDYKLKVGELNVDIINHTTQLYNDSIQKFNIFVESDWNNIIRSVYADIIINGTEAKTTPANLENFEERTITAYIDTTSIPIGNHTVEMDLYFATDSKKQFSNIEIIERPVIEEPKQINWTIIGLIIIIVLLLAVMVIFIIIFSKKLLKNDNNLTKKVTKKSKGVKDDKEKPSKPKKS